MKRNLLIGTSLVAAFSATALDARSFSVMTEESRKDNTALSSAIHMVTEGHKRSTGKTALKAGDSDAFAAVYQAALEKVSSGKEGKATVAEIAKALATNVELRKLVDGFRPAVIAAVAEEQKKPVVAPVDQDIEILPEPNKDVVTSAELLQAVADTTNTLVGAINAEAAAKKIVENATATVNTLTKEKADADKALTDAQTELKEAETKAAVAKTATENATADLTALTTEKKVKEEKITAAEKAITDKTTAVTTAEAQALDILKTELAAIDAKIAAATTTQTDTAAALVAADKLVADAKAKVEVTTKAQVAAATALETALKTKADADTALTAKTKAVAEITAKLATAQTALKDAAEKAKTEAEAKAKEATEAAGTAEIKKAELATVAEASKAKIIELGKKQTALNVELTAARAADAANSTDATKAAVATKEAAVVAIATELAQAKIAEVHAKQAAKVAEAVAATAVILAEKATEAKKAAATELDIAKDAVKTADEAVKAAKATIAQADVKAQADAQAAKTADDAKAAEARATKIATDLKDLEDKLAGNAGNAELIKAVEAKKAELEQAKKDVAAAALAAKTAAETAQQAAVELDTAKKTALEAEKTAQTLTIQLAAAQEKAQKSESELKEVRAAHEAEKATVDQLKSALRNYNTFLKESAKTSDVDLLDAATLDELFGVEGEGAETVVAGSGKEGLEAFKTRTGFDLFKIDAQLLQKLDQTWQKKDAAMRNEVDILRVKQEENERTLDAAEDNADSAARFLSEEVQPRNTALAELKTQNEQFEADKDAADAETQATIQGTINENKGQIAELTQWFLTNAVQIEHAQVTLENQEVLRTNVAALQDKLTALHEKNKEIVQSMQDDYRTLEVLINSVRDARDKKIEELAIYAVELEAVVAKIVNSELEVSADADEEGSDTDFVHSGQANASFGSHGALPMTGTTSVNQTVPLSGDANPTAATGVASSVTGDTTEANVSGQVPETYTHPHHPSIDDVEAARLVSEELSTEQFGRGAPDAGSNSETTTPRRDTTPTNVTGAGSNASPAREFALREEAAARNRRLAAANVDLNA